MKLLLDAHVHVYPYFSVKEVLDVASMRTKQEGFDGAILCFTERSTENYFAELSKTEDFVQVENLNVKLGILRGSQIKTKEKLEVLHYGARSTLPDGLAHDDVISHCAEHAPLYSLAWGFGKWWSPARKSIIERALEQYSPSICDSAMRPVCYPQPELFKKAKNILLGSDPLPKSGQQKQILRYCREYEVSNFPSSVEQVIALMSNEGKKFGTRRSALEFFNDNFLGRLPRQVS